MLCAFAGMACAAPRARASTQMPPLTAPTTERVVRLVSVHGGETDWVATQAAMLVRYVDLPFRLYTTVRDGQIGHVSETWLRITGDAPALVANYSTAMKAAQTWNGDPNPNPNPNSNPNPNPNPNPDPDPDHRP